MTTQIFWIDAPVSGKLGIMPRPRGADGLVEEVHSMRGSGVNVVISLLTAAEKVDLELEEEERECQATGIDFLNFPIPDRQIPPLDFETLTFLREVVSRLADVTAVVVHCRMGVGRASIIAAAVLVLCGVEAEAALEMIEKARGCEIPDTQEQREWVRRFAESYGEIRDLGELWVV